jgi:hypothetical protein
VTSANRWGWFLLPLLAIGCAGDGAEREIGATRTMVIETGPMTIDRIYPSMTGPTARIDIDTSDMAWITAVSTEVVDGVDDSPMSQEFFCHSQLQLVSGPRLTVTAMGIRDLRFPEGFGIPIGEIFREIPAEAREVSFYGMVLNNHVANIDRTAKVRATIEYLNDEDLGDRPPLRRLYQEHITMVVEDLRGYEPPPGYEADSDVSSRCVPFDDDLRHWLVPPGPQKTRIRYRGILPVESTVHYAAAHLHNHGEYVRLTDLTTGELLWQADADYEPDRRQIANISHYSSAEGFRMYPDHDYELEAFYDNTYDTDIDAMALIYIYFTPAGDQELYLVGPDREG